MSEQPEVLVDEFLDGRRTLAELQASLQALLAANKTTAPQVLRHVDEVYRKGWLQPQVYQLLKEQLEPGTTDQRSSRERARDDSTMVAHRMPRTSAHDETVGGLTKKPQWKKARLAPDPVTGASNWEHPEQWTAVHDAPVGPRSILKNRFLLEERLGEGGMGVVYKALDRNRAEANDPQPYIAIKILNEAFREHPAALVALQREARRAQDLSHPNVVTVHDFDRDGTLVYMTMELLDGQQLGDVIDANRFGGLAPETAIPWITDLARAVAYAHKKGVVHCDLKPSNVFVTRNGDIKVFDFGIARALPSSLKDGAKADTFDAADLGAYTEAYASPEVLAGEAPVEQDDVFALGIVAYELLTGGHPFERVPADEACTRKLKPAPIAGIARRRRKALARALAFERSARQKHAGEFLQEFQPVPIRHWAYAGTAAVALVAGYVAIGDPLLDQWLLQQSFLRLPIDQQQAFNRYIEEGQRGLEFDALPEALELFSSAFAIHPYNARAIAGLEDVADRLLSRPSSAEDLRANIGVLYCQEYLATYDDVVAQCAKLFGAAACREPDNICSAEKSD